MFDLNTTLVKEPLTRMMKAQFEYGDQAEALDQTNAPRQGEARRGPKWLKFSFPFWFRSNSNKVKVGESHQG